MGASQDTTSETLKKSETLSSEYSIEKIREALIEKRKHNCANIINERKRRLCELYTVAKVPLVAISSEHVLQSEGELKRFLEKNDLQKGVEFTITALRREHAEPPRKKMKKLKKASHTKTPNPNLLSGQDNTNTTHIDKALDKKVSEKEDTTKIDVQTIKNQKKEEALKAMKVSLQKRIELLRKNKKKTVGEENTEHGPTLLDQIQRFKKNPTLTNTELHSNRDLDWQQMKLDDLLLTLMPARKPHKVAAARSLTELYYHEQTLQLPKLLLRAHKVLTSKSFETSLVEGKVAVLFSRIEELKKRDRWSLRQPRKHADPFLHNGGMTFWDSLLSEAQWVATDMKQSRRYRAAKCCEISGEVDEYWKMQNKSKTIAGNKIDKHQSSGSKFVQDDNIKSSDEKVMKEDSSLGNHLDIAKSEDKDAVSGNRSSDDNKRTIMKNMASTISKQAACIDPLKTVIHPSKIEIPVKLFQNPAKLSLEIIVKDLPTAGRVILDKLPVYKPFPSGEQKDHEQRVDHAIDRNLFGHVSKLLPPPSGNDEICWEKIVFRKQSDQHINLKNGKNNTNRPLFGRFSHYNVLRPPRPPSVADIQLRIPTIWLPQDDRLLVRYVTQFSFNWDIIAAHLAPRPTACRYFSNIERRTPWQCFERYIQLNNRFRFSDMRGKYTIEARKWLQAAHRVQATTRRRISPLGVGQDSIQRGHRRLRWASMLEAFRKLMRRREAAANVAKASNARNAKLSTENSSLKKSESGSADAAASDSNGNEKSRSDTPTPEQLSKLKSERDRAIKRAYLAANTGRGHHKDNNSNSDARCGQSQLHMQVQVQNQRLMQMQLRLRRQEQIRRLQKIRQIQHARRAQRQQQQQQQLRRQQWQMRMQQQQQQQQQQQNHGKISNNQELVTMSSPTSRSLSSTVSQSPSRRSPTPTPEQILAAGRDHTHSLSSSDLTSPASTSPPHQRGFSAAQVAAVVNQIQIRNPGISRSQATRLAVLYMSNYQKRHRRLRQGRLLRQQQAQQETMPQLQSQMQNSSPAAVSPALSPQASSLSPKIMNSARLNSVAQQIHVHKHTPSPEEIQEAMSQHRASRQELSVDQSMSGIGTPVLSSPPSLHASSTSSPIPNTGQIMGQGTSTTNTNMPRNITDNDANLSLEAIENDILNTDFSLLDDDGLNPN